MKTNRNFRTLKTQLNVKALSPKKVSVINPTMYSSTAPSIKSPAFAAIDIDLAGVHHLEKEKIRDLHTQNYDLSGDREYAMENLIYQLASRINDLKVEIDFLQMQLNNQANNQE